MSLFNRLSGMVNEKDDGEYASHVVLMEIKVYEEVGKAATFLMEEKSVIVNVKTESVDIEKIVSFLEGALFVLGGEMKQLDDGTFLCVPNSVAIVDTGNEEKEEEVIAKSEEEDLTERLNQ